MAATKDHQIAFTEAHAPFPGYVNLTQTETGVRFTVRSKGSNLQQGHTAEFEVPLNIFRRMFGEAKDKFRG